MSITKTNSDISQLGQAILTSLQNRKDWHFSVGPSNMTKKGKLIKAYHEQSRLTLECCVPCSSSSRPPTLRALVRDTSYSAPKKLTLTRKESELLIKKLEEEKRLIEEEARKLEKDKNDELVRRTIELLTSTNSES